MRLVYLFTPVINEGTKFDKLFVNTKTGKLEFLTVSIVGCVRGVPKFAPPQETY